MKRARTESGEGLNQGRARGAAGRPAAPVDRSSYPQYLAEQARLLPCEGNYLNVLAEAHRQHRQLLDRDYAATSRQLLSASGRALVNQCLADIAASLRACGARARRPWEGDKRRLLTTLFETPAGASETVDDVMARDPFHTVLPYFDGPAMMTLCKPEGIPGELREELSQTLHHRFLHGPQRTRHLFFHEMAVGYFLNLLENGGALPGRAAVRVQTTSYAVIPTLFMQTLAQHLGCGVDQLALLHFGSNQEIDELVPAGIRDLMTACAYLYFCCELAVVYRWKGRNGAIIEHVLKFFGLPVLERMGTTPLRLRPDAGRAVERLLIDLLYGPEGASRANEVDLVVALHKLSEIMWAPAAAIARSRNRPVHAARGA